MSENNEKVVLNKDAKPVKNDKKAAKKKKEKKDRRRPFAEMISELKKTSWPSAAELRTYAACVIIFVVVCSVLLFAMDFVATELVTYISEADKLPKVLNGWFGIGG